MDENKLQATVNQGWRAMLLLMMTMTLIWILKGNVRV